MNERKKMELKKYKEFMYVLNNSMQDDEYAESLVPFVRRTLVDQYLNPSLINIKCNSDWESKYKIEHDAEIPHRFIISHMKSRTDVWIWRMVFDNMSIYYEVSDQGDNVMLTVCLYNFKTKVCTYADILLNEDRVSIYTMWYCGRREKDIIRTFNDQRFLYRGTINLYTAKLLTYSLVMYCNVSKDPILKNKYSSLEYNYVEMSILKMIIDVNPGYNDIIVDRRLHPDVVHNIDFYDSIDAINEINGSNHPIVNLKYSDWKYIEHHMKKAHNNYIDIKPVMEHPRYGSALTMKYEDDDGEIMINVDCVINDNIAHIYIVPLEHVVNMTPYIDIMFDDISKPMDEALPDRIFVRCIFNDSKYLVNSINELKELLPKQIFRDALMNNYIGVTQTMLSYLSLQITLEDRPKRIRSVKEIHNAPNESNNVAYNKRNNNDVVIKRILMSDRDAREYINSVSTEHPDRIYVLEEWSRAGHWRQYKNGKRIWIEETQYHRRLPISEDREVKIIL